MRLTFRCVAPTQSRFSIDAFRDVVGKTIPFRFGQTRQRATVVAVAVGNYGKWADVTVNTDGWTIGQSELFGQIWTFRNGGIAEK